MAREWTNDQIAQHAGKADSCITKLTERILSYTEYDGTAHTDGLTTDVLSALMTGGRNSAGLTYGDLGLNAPTIDDVTWAGLEVQKATPYCMGAATPTPTLPPWETPAPGYADITIDSIPQGARISGDVPEMYRLTPETFVMLSGEHTITVKKDGYIERKEDIVVLTGVNQTHTWALTSEAERPVEIRIIPRALKGSVDIGTSDIPREIMRGVYTKLRMHIDNKGIPAKFKLTLRLANLLNSAESYSFPSDWTESINSGSYKNIYMYVYMPVTCSLGDYDLWSILEAEAV